MTASAAAYRSALSLVAGCAEASSETEFIDILLPGLASVIGFDELALSVVDVRTRRVHALSSRPTAGESVPAALAYWQERSTEHPYIRRYLRTGHATAARLSDIHSFAELRRSAFYGDFYRHRGLRHGLTVLLAVDGDRITGLGAGRSLSDFSDSDVDLLESLRRPLTTLLRRLRRPPSVLAAFTPAERRVAELVVAGRRNDEVARAMGVSTKAVEQHLTRMYRRLGVSSRTQLVALSLSGRPSA